MLQEGAGMPSSFEPGDDVSDGLVFFRAVGQLANCFLESVKYFVFGAKNS